MTHEGGRLSVRHRMPTSWWQKVGPFWWFAAGRRRYPADVTIAVPPTARASLTLISGSVVASGLRRGATVDVTSGSITLMGLGGTVTRQDRLRLDPGDGRLRRADHGDRLR